MNEEGEIAYFYNINIKLYLCLMMLEKTSVVNLDIKVLDPL